MIFIRLISTGELLNKFSEFTYKSLVFLIVTFFSSFAKFEIYGHFLWIFAKLSFEKIHKMFMSYLNFSQAQEIINSSAY